MSEDLTAQADTMAASAPRGVVADHFDGHSAQPRKVLLCLRNGQLTLLDPDTGIMRDHLDPRQVQWPERTRHGARIAHLPDGGSLHALDPVAWDQWRTQEGHRASWIVRSQQSWRAVLVSVLLLIAALAAAYQWGLPLAAQATLSITPRALDKQIGQTAFASLDERWFQPSRLAPATQQALQNAFHQAAQRARIRQAVSKDLPFQVVFRRSKMGPNALTFPDGTIVITDELVDLLDQRKDLLIGVFGHEWGHLQHRHSMRLLIQAAAVSTIASFIVGDFSSMLAAAPAMLGSMAYSRDFERQADDVSIQVLKANGIAPSCMVVMFDKLQSGRDTKDASGPGWALSSHPGDAERRARFQTP